METLDLGRWGRRCTEAPHLQCHTSPPATLSLMPNLMHGKNAQGPWEVNPSDQGSLRPLTLTESSVRLQPGGKGWSSLRLLRESDSSAVLTHTLVIGMFCTKAGTAVKTHRQAHWTSAPSTVNTMACVLPPPQSSPKCSGLTKVLLWSTGKMDPAELADRKTAQIFLFSFCGYDNWVFSLLLYPSYIYIHL